MNIKKAIKNVKDTNIHVNNMYSDMKGFSENFAALMKGDDKGPYWNGYNASKFYQEAKTDLDKVVAYYDKVRRLLMEYAVNIEELARKNNTPTG